jgi:hypothetical protein
MTLDLLTGSYAICRLSADAALPSLPAPGGFWSATRTANELSIICASDDVPADARAERGYRGLVVRGPLAFSQIGIVAALSTVLAAASISIFAVSTYDTDYVFVRGTEMDRTIEVLRNAGHTLIGV